METNTWTSGSYTLPIISGAKLPMNITESEYIYMVDSDNKIYRFKDNISTQISSDSLPYFVQYQLSSLLINTINSSEQKSGTYIVKNICVYKDEIWGCTAGSNNYYPFEIYKYDEIYMKLINN